MKGMGEYGKQVAMIAAYNQGKVELDMLDQALLDVRPLICGKKWYWLLVNTINIAFAYS